MDRETLNQNLIDSGFQEAFNRLLIDLEYRTKKGFKTEITQKTPYIWEIKTKPSGFIANLTKKTNIIEIWATRDSSHEDGVLFHIRYFNRGTIFFDSENMIGKEVIKKIREEESWWMFDLEED
tara:strand:- start:43 stop:411 length:369 start_codon:yes stop_codon:yes gene_type:complete